MKYVNGLGDVRPGDIAEAGGKAVGLGGLIQAGLPAPPGFVLTTDAYTAFVTDNNLGQAIQELAAALPSQATTEDYEHASALIRTLFSKGAMPSDIEAGLKDAYELLGGGNTAVSVRSSATAEDLASASFAGQQETYLNVRGMQALAKAVIDCWASLWTARAMSYRAREGVLPDQVRLAVVVQQMVEAEAAGVMFTANPANGRRDQTAISAAWGLGEAVVSGAVTTDDLTVDTATGKVLSRQTADKELMTVPTAEGTAEQKVAEARRRAPVLDDTAAAELAGFGRRIADHFGAPQDIEWARADGQFFLLQSRPVTALPEPAADVPTEWPVPYPKGLYFRASIVEQMPEPLSPLFADLIDGSVSRSISALMNDALGQHSLREGDVRFPTVNGYAYYYYRTWPMLRMTARTVPAMRALFRGTAHMGMAGWRDYSHPRYERTIKDWSAKPPSGLPGAELLAGVQALLDAGTVYYTAVQSVIPMADMSELSFRGFYRTVRRDGDPPAQDFLLGFDSEPIRAEKSLYDLAGWARSDPSLVTALVEQPTAELARCLRTGSAPAGVDDALWQEWRITFQEHLALYGHAVYNLDFATPVPADDPTAQLETVKFYLRAQGTDPHERQRLLTERRESLTREMASRLGPRRRALFFRLLKWAQETAPLREDALADVGLAWPLLRRMLLELGRRLVSSGVIGSADDVFWLRFQELHSAVEFGLADVGAGVSLAGASRPVRAAAVEERRMLWRGQSKASAPQMLPQKAWMEKAFGSMMPAGPQHQAGDVIKGAAASSGRVTAPARVVRGPEDFGRMQPGEVLVARMTTPAWTPLFAMASAVVTDVGGPLSHSSIVAREYGIPAVLGTGVATQRLAGGQKVRVDGDAGTVTIERTAQPAGG
ncbi:phosphohistidine swiveling domain-containing protein [Pseudarthrobacter defluvii]|uniref:PEP/pyruvate-binding domain-containing protein n=1 Tax=Pseudarthrobacter defluvii TaxID=410837 RepID=UPI00278AB05D|nr:PEP/pyruvate-binding domain-containing protein [Pseudarthrobacter defluvii]MDQ0770308.1 phosphohistidine swiveling domain-containing protein [Pseudarthrobacter defluvii]